MKIIVDEYGVTSYCWGVMKKESYTVLTFDKVSPTSQWLPWKDFSKKEKAKKELARAMAHGLDALVIPTAMVGKELAERNKLK